MIMTRPPRQFLTKQSILKDLKRGVPDGSYLDTEGFIWNCRVVGGACVVMMDFNRNINRVIELPRT